jgi:hypothetical protein
VFIHLVLILACVCGDRGSSPFRSGISKEIPKCLSPSRFLAQCLRALQTTTCSGSYHKERAPGITFKNEATARRQTGLPVAETVSLVDKRLLRVNNERFAIV